MISFSDFCIDVVWFGGGAPHIVQLKVKWHGVVRDVGIFIFLLNSKLFYLQL
jgi:hypothetical protein